MKKTLKLNRETVRVLAQSDLARAAGGEFNSDFCTVRDTLCCPTPPRGPGGGTINTCFAGCCETIISQ